MDTYIPKHLPLADPPSPPPILNSPRGTNAMHLLSDDALCANELSPPFSPPYAQ